MNRTRFDHGIKPTPMDVTCVLSAKAQIGEGPWWSAAEQKLYWVDILGKNIHVFDPKTGGNQTYTLPDIVTCAAPKTSGGLIVSMRTDIATYDPATGKLTPVATPKERPGNRFNDGKVDRQGRLWAGTMGDVDWDSPVGTLYRYDGKEAVAMESSICCSNGLGWSPDSKTMYFTESFRYRIFAYDFEASSGRISNRRVFLELDPHGSAFPDGMTVDAEGYVWCAQPMFGRIARYDPKGTLERVVELPVSRGTGVCFGGPNLDTLYVTTMRTTLSEAQLAEEPLAGSLLAFKPGVKGLAETPFAG
ncbi:MAG TPA: SMP-30/gluconolactonase/LRE family protein [Polyangia bacterium]|nr:SMP-30/gluconolactonase/LRE family protein [Polyangia bacterium]